MKDVDPKRLAQIRTLHPGTHEMNADGLMCAMEAVAYVAGEPWSDHPECACPVIATFVRAWNDGLQDEERAILLPLLAALVGTRAPVAVKQRRAIMATDWLVRIHTPRWLRLAGMEEQASFWESAQELTTISQVASLRGPLEDLRRDASATSMAAGAAFTAAGVAAVARTAGFAASAAASPLVGAAARAAADGAAYAHLVATKAGMNATISVLQTSAFAMVEDMIALN